MNGPIPPRPQSLARSARKRGTIRRLARVAFLAAAAVALLPVLGETRWSLLVPASSPWVAVASWIAVGGLPLAAWLGLAVGLVGLVRRRWFCRWVCPTGTCAEVATLAGQRLGRRCLRLPPVGQWIVLVTLGGALLGYPLLLWLDPLALFAGMFGMTAGRAFSVAWWSASGIACVLGLSLVWPGVWCLRLCPLGAFQDMLAACGRAMRRAIVGSRATEEVGSRATEKQEPDRGFTRRTLLGTLVGIGWALAARPVRASAERPLRPPGALDEARLAGVCIRCGNCLRACPTGVIALDRGDHGIAGLLTPTVRFMEDYCREDCTRCGEVCPSGAIRAIPLDQKQLAPIGIPRIDMTHCLLGDDRDCAACRNWCPFEAISLVFDEVDYTLVPKIDLAKCPGCGACETACPTTPKAIVIRPR